MRDEGVWYVGMYTERGVADEGVWWTCTQRGVWQMKGCGGHVHREGCGR